jgi:hypothetical protein
MEFKAIYEKSCFNKVESEHFLHNFFFASNKHFSQAEHLSKSENINVSV